MMKYFEQIIGFINGSNQIVNKNDLLKLHKKNQELTLIKQEIQKTGQVENSLHDDKKFKVFVDFLIL